MYQVPVGGMLNLKRIVCHLLALMRAMTPDKKVLAALLTENG
jgi:hypothetical protein